MMADFIRSIASSRLARGVHRRERLCVFERDATHAVGGLVPHIDVNRVELVREGRRFENGDGGEGFELADPHRESDLGVHSVAVGRFVHVDIEDWPCAIMAVIFFLRLEW